MRKQFSNSGFAWVSGLAARTASHQIDDSRFTDEEILTVVRAGESGMKLADLCEATGISVTTYYEWKARYGGLSAQQLHAQRLLARSRRRRLTMLACAVAVAAVGVGGLMITRRSDAAAFVPPVVPAPPPATAPAPATPTTPAALPVATTATATTTPVATTTAVAKDAVPDGVAADPNAYSVQVAAVPDLQQARLALEKLTMAGYPAHVTTRTVNRVEMYRVRVGPLDTRVAAEQVAARLKQDGYSSPWVTR